MTDTPHWGLFEDRRGEQPVAPARDDEFAALCARLFTGPDGKDLLRFLRAETIDRVMRAEIIPEAALRAIEAQRQLVRRLERLRDQGLAAAAAKKPA